LSDNTDIAAIVLAAGASRRFGSDKLLHPLTLHGVTLPLAAHSLTLWLETFAVVTVVVRPGAEAFCAAIGNALNVANSTRLRWTICENADQGMATSLAYGVRANKDAAGWLIGLADMPAVPLAAIAAVRQALLAGAELAAPFCEHKRGHPVGFSARYLAELLKLQGDAGARHLLERDKSNIEPVEISNRGILADIDKTDDLEYFNT
jgi:molybdenum cofactor cytidylyltransferase